MIDCPVAGRPGLTVMRQPAGATGYFGAERRTTRSKVLVLADDLLVAEVLQSAILQSGFLARSGVPATTRHHHDVVAWRPDLALLDVDLNEQRSRSVELIGDLRRAGVAVAVLARNVDQMWEDSIQAGAAVVVDKSTPLSHLVGTFCQLLRHDNANQVTVRRTLLDHPEAAPESKISRSNPLAVLTGREGSILVELMAGHRAEVIASSSHVSISTVRSQIKSILQKLGVNSQLAAVAMARQAGWSGDRDQSVSNRQYA
jgi:two-component system nitrate/nitrite response regulator NarL